MPNLDATVLFDEIYNSTNKAVLTFITVKCGRTDDISDIFQDTYMELYHVLSKRGVEYVTNDKALVFRIAKRKIARYYSFRERLRLFVPLTAVYDEEEVELSDWEADAFVTEDFAVSHILLETVRQRIGQKPEDVQKVFYLFYGINLSIPEIAQALSMSESNVKNKLYRTLKELRALLT